MIKVIAFDLDDTLWHVDPVIIRAEQILKDWLIEHVPGFPYDMHYMNQFRKQVLADQPKLAGRLTEFRRRVIEKALIHHGRKDSTKIAAEAMRVFLIARNQVEFFDGALETLGIVAEHYRLGAITNGNADIFKLGLDRYFSFAFCAEEVGAPKPAPDLFHKALSHTGVSANEMVYVGDDRIKDIDAAKAIGIKTVWLRNERRAGPGNSEPDSIIDTIEELPNAINRIENRV